MKVEFEVISKKDKFVCGNKILSIGEKVQVIAITTIQDETNVEILLPNGHFYGWANINDFIIN
jgi:hypothetical protein